MFDIGFGELLLVAVVALVVLGPERLPAAARTLGALLRRARESWNSVRSEVERELEADELRNTARQAAERARHAEQVMRETVRRASEEVRGEGAATPSSASSAGDAAPPPGAEHGAEGTHER